MKLRHFSRKFVLEFSPKLDSFFNNIGQKPKFEASNCEPQSGRSGKLKLMTRYSFGTEPRATVDRDIQMQDMFACT
jgi:hypothetical protein